MIKNNNIANKIKDIYKNTKRENFFSALYFVDIHYDEIINQCIKAANAGENHFAFRPTNEMLNHIIDGQNYMVYAEDFNLALAQRLREDGFDDITDIGFNMLKIKWS